jgi:hypothetical protein
MNTLKINTYSVIALDDNVLVDIYGGGIITDAVKAIGYAIGYAAGVIKDAIEDQGRMVIEAGNTAAVVAFK